MDPIDQIKLLSVTNKLMTATEKKAKALGIDEDKYTEEKIEPILKRVEVEIPKDLPSQLELFRKAVGEDMWASIAQNPSLPVLVTQHMVGVKEKSLSKIKEELVKELEGYMSEEDLDTLFRLQCGV